MHSGLKVNLTNRARLSGLLNFT